MTKNKFTIKFFKNQKQFIKGRDEENHESRWSLGLVCEILMKEGESLVERLENVVNIFSCERQGSNVFTYVQSSPVLLHA